MPPHHAQVTHPSILPGRHDLHTSIGDCLTMIRPTVIGSRGNQASVCVCVSGSPGQLSPVSTISNGPAPTIPSAPMSPRSGIQDPFDLEQFNFDFASAQLASPKASPGKPRSTAGSVHGYQREYVPGMSPQPQRSASAYGSLEMKVSPSPSRDPYASPGMDRPSSAGPFGVRQETGSLTGRERVQSPYESPTRTSVTSRTPSSPYGGTRESPLSPPTDRAAMARGRKSPSVSYGAPKEDISKPFAEPNYPA